MNPIHRTIEEYYTGKVRQFGCTPFGVDWTCTATQEMRFVQLLKLCDFRAPFTVNDLGCGYGALAGFLRRRDGTCAIDYLGIDLSTEMVRRARAQWRGVDGIRFVKGSASPRVADYSVASGIFNVRLATPVDAWEAFVRETLRQMAATSRRGFAVNLVNSLPRDGLYTTSPDPWVQYCDTELGADAKVLEGYGMHEFSLLVRPRRARLPWATTRAPLREGRCRCTPRFP